ncbi:MAG TPA: hypothetical protein PKE55_02935 [Kiritimatiellia bacterium]|nr:hypothetical protein [Kiritimatiellia bacterium]
MTKHLTIRGIDEQTETELKALARRRNLSINKAALALIRKGAGIRETGDGPAVIGSGLDAFIGTWSEKDEKEVLTAIEDFSRIDEDLWR